MTAKTLEEQAREMVGRLHEGQHGQAIIALRRYAQDEYDQLKRATAQHLRWIADTLVGSFSEATESAFVLGYTACDKEIEELRARVRELEGMVPKWVNTSDRAVLKNLKWIESCAAQNLNGPGYLWLMVPPIPVPEGES